MTDLSPAAQMREAAMIACYNIAKDWENYAPAAATAYRVAARDCGATIRALPLPPEPMVTVKPLVWAKHPYENIWRSDTEIGTYIAFGIGPTPSWDFDGFVSCSSKTANNIEDAKTTAHADYAARILSAITMIPNSVAASHADDPSINLLVGLLKEARSDLCGYLNLEYPDGDRVQHQFLERRYQRDMDLCRRIDDAIWNTIGDDK